MISLNTPQSLPSKYVKYVFTWIFLNLAVISLLFSIATRSWTSAFFSLSFLAIPLLLYIFLDYKNISFQVNNESIVIKSGIIFKKSKAIPFRSVQNVKLSAGLLQRLFGLSIVEIWTSSQSQLQTRNGRIGEKPDGALVLDNKDAEQLRDMITQK